RHDWFEVPRRVAVDHRQVAAADARQARTHPHPAGAGRIGLVDVLQRDRSDGGTLAGHEASGDGRGRVLRELALEQECFHLTVTRPAKGKAGAIGSNLRGPPADLSKCSTSQPRLRAMAARRVSGFTATGKPTASSIGRSDAESA